MKQQEVLNYGFTKIIKKYANFPVCLPIPCHMEHGWTALPGALKTDLETEKRLVFVFSRRRAEAWKKASKTPVEIMGSPFIHYKNMRRYTTKPGAKGTVVFPTHSTYDLKPVFDIGGLCDDLDKLPNKYKPITICLFWIDYINFAKEYKKRGFKVVSAGARFTNSLSFVKKFYKILAHHKYAASNEVGSYTFYAVDFKMPFFLVGECPELKNINNKDKNIGASARLVDYEMGVYATKLFLTGPNDKILPQQKEFVEDEMGVNDCLKPRMMNEVLLKFYNQEKPKNLVKYWMKSIFNWTLFNTPLTPILIRIRNRMSK